jgi:3-oxoacyl-(acyl-carrier-protein) synthase
MEIQNWCLALGRNGRNFPPVNSLKSMIGHCLSAAGSIESVAAVLQIVHQFIHPNINLDDPNPGDFATDRPRLLAGDDDRKGAQDSGEGKLWLWRCQCVFNFFKI